MPTMADVAKRAGVALSTVSYALNGTRPISEETRQRIFAVMDELGYKPHVLARGLASKRSKIIALLFPTPERGLGLTELEFVTSAAEAARGKGYHLALWSAPTDGADLAQLLNQGLVDGVLVMEVHLEDPRIALLREQDFPFSMIGRCGDSGGASYVDIDFERTAQTAVGHLAGLGHRHIAFVNHSQETFAAGYGPTVRAQNRFHQAIAAAGLDGFSVFCHPSAGAGFETFNQLIGEHPEITALIVMNERAIPGIIQAIADHGGSVPADFSIVSLVSSARVAEMTLPTLTALEAPAAELGALGVDLLIRQLEAEARDLPQALLPCRLVVRGSTGRVTGGR
ncbi:MAG TPA: LacI family DNA-binding transcriptional regulator [Herpetosiphonaceae bacterium]|nr:LacI family DNA-binding transcriptional regulator [Herpetosiphonaceae bacterium]